MVYSLPVALPLCLAVSDCSNICHCILHLGESKTSRHPLISVSGTGAVAIKLPPCYDMSQV